MIPWTIIKLWEETCHPIVYQLTVNLLVFWQHDDGYPNVINNSHIAQSQLHGCVRSYFYFRPALRMRSIGRKKKIKRPCSYDCAVWLIQTEHLSIEIDRDLNSWISSGDDANMVVQSCCPRIDWNGSSSHFVHLRPIPSYFNRVDELLIINR